MYFGNSLGVVLNLLLMDSVSTAIPSEAWKVITKMANPMANSAAATIGTNEANDWPIKSSEETENF